MPKIKIIKAPKKKKISKFFVGGEDCPEGYIKDEYGNCMPDLDAPFAPFAPKVGKRTGVSFDAPGNFLDQKQIVQKPTKALAPALPTATPSIQMPASNTFDIWGNQTDINGQNPNAMNMPKQTIVDANGNRTTKGIVDIGNPTMYEAQQTPRAKTPTPFKFQKPPKLGAQALNMGSAIANYVETQKKQNRYNDWQASNMLPDNFSAVNKGSDRGWYDKNDGMFDPYKMGYKGRREYGGSLPYAAEGILVQGDVMAREAYVPELAPIRFVAPPTSARQVEASAQTPVEVVAPSVITESSSSLNSELAFPVENYVITSKFGKRKAPKGPSGPASSNHNGIDLAVPVNSNIFSPMDGVVKNVYKNSAGGNQLLIQHSDGSISGYAHLNKFNVNIGDKVTKGQVVALSGNTGNSNGPHLHFTWHTKDGRTVDPMSIFDFEKSKPKGKPVSETQVSLTHNNPMNIHYGDFAAKYGAKAGADDMGGKVAIFPDLATGIKANKDLLFGSGYINLTVSQARNRWVSGNPNVSNASTSHIVKAMGGDKKLSELSPEEKDKLFKQFTKWEGSQGFNLIKDYKLFNNGGENNNTMKIRIMGGPDHMAHGGQPQYSGQSDYGLYIGQRDLYKTMPKNPYDEAGDSVKEQPESESNPHVLEAEGGETILRPDGTHMKINGRSHAEGGVKLNKSQAPEGSFIYSDTQKMKIKNPEILRHFNKAPKNAGITPADIAKQYDINRYMGILQNPNTDYLSKQTAMKMVQNYQRKLAELALVQEGIKGFPQGVPEVAKSVLNAAAGPMQGQDGVAPGMGQEFPQTAKYGGALHKFVYATGGPKVPMMDPEFLDAIKFMTDFEQEGSEDGTNGYVGGGKNWGTNKNNIKSQQQAIEYYYKNYWPRVKDLPAGLRTRALQLAVNTGDPYGELMVAASSFKGVDPMSPEDRIATKGQRKDLSPADFKGDDWKKRQDQVIAAYNENSTEFMKNLDAEQSRYYNQGLQGMNADQTKFQNEYYQGVGKIANKYVKNPTPVQNPNPMSYDPFGVKDMLANAGTTNTKTGAPVSTAPTSSAPAAQQQTVPKWFTPWLKSNTKAGSISPTGEPTVFNPKDPNKFYQDYNKWKTLNNGQDFKGPKEFQEFLYDYVEKNNPKALEKMWDKWGTTALGKTIPKEQKTKKAFADNFFGARTAELMSDVTTIPPTTTLPPPGTTTTTLPVPGTTTTTLPPGITTTTTLPSPTIPLPDYGWTQQDIRNYMNAGADYASLKKYHPYSTRVQPVLPEFVPVDWRGQAAALQSSTNAAANQLGAYTPGQGMASNLSSLAGQQAENLGKAISGVDQYNAAGASNMDLQRANMLNQFTQYNAQNTDKDFAEENVYDDRFRTGERVGRKGIVKTRNQGEDTATKLYNLNQVESPYYNINPYTQMMYFNSDNAKAKFMAENSGGYQAPAGSGAAAVKAYQEIYDGLTSTREEDRADVALSILNGTNSTKVKKRDYPANINRNYTETTETKNKEDE